MRLTALVVVLVGACIHSNATQCENGLYCSGSLVCDEGHRLCVLPDQLTACAGKDENAPCTFGDEDGECTDGVCIATYCGDGLVTGLEECDGDTLPATLCTELGYYDEGPDKVLACSGRCAYDISKCTGKCGDNTRDGQHEYCDGGELPDNDDSCVTFGYDAGTLTCSEFCSPGFAECTSFRWVQESLAGDVSAIWAADAKAVFAVGKVGLIMRWDGSSFTTTLPLTTMNLNAVWGTSADDVYVAGGTSEDSGPPSYTTVASTGTILHWDGVAWTQMTLPAGTPELFGIWVGGGAGFAVGRNFPIGNPGTILRFDGTAWTAMTSPATTTFRSVWAASPDDVFVGSDYGLHRYTGTWAPLQVNTSIASVFGLGSSSVFATGYGGAFYFDGQALNPIATPPCTDNIWDVWASAPDNVYAAAYFANGSKGLFHYNGRSWTPLAIPPLWMTSVWGVAPDDIWAGSYNGMYHNTGVSEAVWPNVPAPTCTQQTPSCAHDPFTVIAGSNDDDVYAFDTATMGTCHYDGAAWTRIPNVDAGIASAWVSPTGDVFGVGSVSLGTVACPNPNPPPATNDVPIRSARAVRGSAATTWTTDDLDPNGHSSLSDVWGTASSNVYAVGVTGTTADSPCDGVRALVKRWNGSTWTDIVAPAGLRIATKIWGRSPTDIYVMGIGTAGPTVYRFDGNTTWTELPPFPGACLAVHDMTGAAQHVFVTCFGAKSVFRYDGSAWTSTKPHGLGFGVDINILAFDHDDVFVLAGGFANDGKVAHYKDTAADAPPSPVRVDGPYIGDAWGTEKRIFWVNADGVTMLVRNVSW